MTNLEIKEMLNLKESSVRLIMDIPLKDAIDMLVDDKKVEYDYDAILEKKIAKAHDIINEILSDISEGRYGLRADYRCIYGDLKTLNDEVLTLDKEVE